MGFEYPPSEPNEGDWEHLYTQLSPDLFQYGCKICADPNLVEDCMHDVFVNFFRSATRSNIKNPKAYLLKSLRHSLMAKLKADARQRELLSGEFKTQFEAEFSTESLQIIRETNEVQRQELSNALQHLSARQREAIYLKFYENHSYEEVSDIMKVDKSALYTLIYKSLQQMKNAMRRQKASRLIVGMSLLCLMGIIFL